ncbi:Coenzyme F420 hydrogenase/dehydrogenase, beta subunit C-terminal domain [Variovorax sp. DT-64]|uniref:Coenzyme F420 hydrogenase/dehydrogenase, beta subunit C-terminal domain n=1 Tax=Variovorax sp. DT-64 TaxID=3396160 RepID=UPI003F53E6A2
MSPRDMQRAGLCVGCGACVSRAPAAGARMMLDRHGELKPAGPEAWIASRSAEFARLCPFSPSAADETTIAQALYPDAPQVDPMVGRFESAYVGHAAQGQFRAEGSSGGLVSWVAAELLRVGLVDGVAHVGEGDSPGDGEPFFRYRISRSPEEVCRGAKSRYYPVEMSGVLSMIRAVPGRYAVVGVPCFIKAIQLLRREDPVVRERVVFTLGLFCGHMKSARMVESFAHQAGVRLEDVRQLDFRVKDPQRPANWYTVQFTLRDGRTLRHDWFHLAEGDWGSGFFQNAACNYCDDVVAETADIAFGDAWVEPYSSDGRGTNVMVVRSAQLRELIDGAVAEQRLRLESVDAAFVQRTQAAGFRQRREGLAYRLTWRRRGLRPRKRVPPSASSLGLRRKLVYRMRAAITMWSRRLYRLATWIRLPGLYLRWARAATALYHALAYSRGWIGRVLDRCGLKDETVRE